jgi:hypothetical protein
LECAQQEMQESCQGSAALVQQHCLHPVSRCLTSAACHCCCVQELLHCACSPGCYLQTKADCAAVPAAAAQIPASRQGPTLLLLLLLLLQHFVPVPCAGCRQPPPLLG